MGQTGDIRNGNLHPRPRVRSAFFSALDDARVAAIGELQAVGTSLSLSLRSMGGAAARVSPDATAFAHRDAEVMLVAAFPDPAGCSGPPDRQAGPSKHGRNGREVTSDRGCSKRDASPARGSGAIDMQYRAVGIGAGLDEVKRDGRGESREHREPVSMSKSASGASATAGPLTAVIPFRQSGARPFSYTLLAVY
jgi:hypothetical protein